MSEMLERAAKAAEETMAIARGLRLRAIVDGEDRDQAKPSRSDEAREVAREVLLLALDPEDEALAAIAEEVASVDTTDGLPNPKGRAILAGLRTYVKLAQGERMVSEDQGRKD